MIVKHAASGDHQRLPRIDYLGNTRHALLHLCHHELQGVHNLVLLLAALRKALCLLVACVSQVPRLAAVQGTSVLSGRQSQRMTFGGTRTRTAHPTLRWMKGECECSASAACAPDQPGCMPQQCLCTCYVRATCRPCCNCCQAAEAVTNKGACRKDKLNCYMQDLLVEPREGGGLFEHVGSTVCL